MINVNIICVGKIKEKAITNLIDEYSKRLSKYCKLTIHELDDEKIPNNPSLSDEEIVKDKEAKKIKLKLDKIGKTHVILLDLKGKEYTSVEFSNKIDEIATYKCSNITFIIGGSLGFSDEIRNNSSFDKISFSKMTFPHQLFRVFLLEQIYRAFKIQNNETYHK